MMNLIFLSGKTSKFSKKPVIGVKKYYYKANNNNFNLIGEIK